MGMKAVLIVDDEKSFLLAAYDGLARSRNLFQVMVADNSRRAMEILTSTAVDLLVTDLKMPEVDGFALLAWVNHQQPGLPVVVMSAFAPSEIELRLSRLNIQQFIHKPLDIDTLDRAIRSAFDAEKKTVLHGITLTGFLQLVKVERLSCTLTVSSGNHCGVLYLHRGELIDAEVGGRSGMDAAVEILSWSDAKIEMDQKYRRPLVKISSPLEYILMDAFRIKDAIPRSIEPDIVGTTLKIRPALLESEGAQGGTL